MRTGTEAYQRYTNVAVLLHWAIAICIIANLSVGYFMEDFAKPVKGVVVPLHISAGLTVLILTALRIVWRLMHRPPAFDAHMPRHEQVAAHLVHYLLYAGMVLMPLTGWMIISAHPARPGPAVMIWGLIPWPAIGPISHIQPADYQKHWHENFVLWHSIGGWIMIALLVAHVAGALKHQFFDKTPELQRMTFGGRLV